MRTFLQFSGGKDSLACLYVMQPHWAQLTVVWVNSGAAFPETLALMERIKKEVPHFLEIEGHQNIEEHGYPVDVVPLKSTRVGHILEGGQGLRFQSRYTCCGAALWDPMARAMKELGATTIIRGQKRCDGMGIPIRSNLVVEGVRYEFPLEDWTDADVRAYLAEKGVELPVNYRTMRTGLDCWNCTAYLHENAGRLPYMAERHPQKHAHVVQVLSEYSHALDEALQPLRDAL